MVGCSASPIRWCVTRICLNLYSERLNTSAVFGSTVQFQTHKHFAFTMFCIFQNIMILFYTFQAKNMFQAPFFTLMQLDSRIVQLDSCSGLLLVSTLSRCYICETVKEQFCQIGHKLREGEYGACFYAAGEQCDVPLGYQQQGATMGTACTSLMEDQKLASYEGLQNLKMFCARPGSRLWEVRIDGTVLSTHHFKQALVVPPTGITIPHDILQGGNVQETSQSETCGHQSFNFTKLYIIAKKFLFTFKRDGICVLDPEKGKVVLWNNSFRDIVDAKTQNDIMYIWTSSGHIHAVMMLPVDRFLVRLYLHKQYGLCAQLCEQHNNYLMELAQTSSKLQLLADLGTKLENNEVAKRISPLLQEIGKHVDEKQNAQRLKSGIFLVRNMQSLHSKVEEGQDISLQSCPYVQTPKKKSRSLTASPENNRRKKSEGCQKDWKSVSTTSLPELVHHLNGTGIFMEDGTQFHRELCALDVLSNSEGNILVSQTNSELKSIRASDTDPTFCPEALQALKEVRHSVLWKSLREKWQVFEGKMKLLGQDIAFEPLAITPADYQEAILEEELSNEDVELVYSSSDKLRTGLYFPMIDVSNVVDLCVRLITHEQNGGNKSELIYEFLNAVSNIYQLFVTEIRTHCSMADDTAQTSNLRSELNMVGSFPFSHYFTDDMIKIIRDKFHFALQTRCLITWLQDKIQDVQHTEQFPEHFKRLYSEDTLKLDVLLSNVLVIYSGLLDPTQTLRYIQTSNLRCYYLSLCVILDRYEEGNLSSKSEYASGHATYDELPPPLLLSTIFFMFSVECVANCCKFSKQVSVKDVWYLVMRLQQHLEGTGRKTDAARSHCYTLFLSYLEKIPECNDCLSEVFADDQLRLYVTTAFEELNSVTSGVCACGFPMLIPPTVCYSDLAEFIVLYYWENNQGYLIELCKKVPSLWYLVLRRRRKEGFNSVLPLIIHLGDTLELANWLSCMDHAAWVQTLDLLTTFQSGTCLNCGSMFTTFSDKLGGVLWSSFGLLIVKALGPHEAVRLLTKYASHIKSGDLDAR